MRNIHETHGPFAANWLRDPSGNETAQRLEDECQTAQPRRLRCAQMEKLIGIVFLVETRQARNDDGRESNRQSQIQQQEVFHRTRDNLNERGVRMPSNSLLNKIHLRQKPPKSTDFRRLLHFAWLRHRFHHGDHFRNLIRFLPAKINSSPQIDSLSLAKHPNIFQTITNLTHLTEFGCGLQWCLEFQIIFWLKITFNSITAIPGRRAINNVNKTRQKKNHTYDCHYRRLELTAEMITIHEIQTSRLNVTHQKTGTKNKWEWHSHRLSHHFAGQIWIAIMFDEFVIWEFPYQVDVTGYHTGHCHWSIGGRTESEIGNVDAVRSLENRM